jgi:peptide/nickel transport system substrate-binding protein
MRQAWARFWIGVAAMLLLSCGSPDTAWMLDGRSELRIAIPTGPMHLDPHLEAEVVTNMFCHHFFDPLVFMDSNMKVVPCVASSWQCPDPVTWVFNLRPGIRFHDGTALTAEDVVYSILRVRDHPLSRKKPILISIKSVEVTGPLTVRIVTHVPYMPLLSKLSQIMIVPAHYYRTHPEDYLKCHPVGSGPYRLAALDFRSEIVMEAVPNHWRCSRLFQRVTFRIVPDETRRARMLLDGETDFIKEWEPDLPGVTLPTKRFRIVAADGIRLIFLGLTFREQLSDGSPNPFRIPAVRQAVSMALDRDLLIRQALPGMARPAEQMVPPLVFGYTPGLHATPFRPEEARRILRENRFPFGKEFSCYYPVGKYHRIAETAEAVRRQLGRAGVRLKLSPISIETFFQKAVTNEYDLFVSGWLPVTGDASDFFEHCFYTRGKKPGYGFFNYVGYSNEALDSTIEESTRVSEREQRLEILQAIMRQSMKDLIWVPLFFLRDSYAFRSELAWRPRADCYILAFQIQTGRPD